MHKDSPCGAASETNSIRNGDPVHICQPRNSLLSTWISRIILILISLPKGYGNAAYDPDKLEQAAPDSLLVESS